MSEPFLKWAGGKRWLVTTSNFVAPSSYRRYFEPFLGSAAVFFHLRPAKSLLSDSNQELIDLYTTVRDRPVELQNEMQRYHECHSTEFYYSVRSSRPESVLERACRTLYLNRTCWNGLYRVNLSGQFNVPIGTKSRVLFEGEDFREAADVLKNADLACCDFAETIDQAGDGDFLFIDPPYTVQHNYNGFVKYNEKLFSWSDQLRLSDSVKAAADRGASIVLTNADHESVRSLYAGICEYRSLSRASVLAGKASSRGATSEAMFLANIR